MENQKYNGWANYPTWAVNLWIENDEGLYSYFRDKISEIKEDNADDPDAQLSELGQAIKDFIEENAPELGASVYSDLIGFAMDSVNYWEIAENMLSDE